MGNITNEHVHQLPDEMFQILLKQRVVLAGPRLGRVTLPRQTMDTPHYLPHTSRGAIPHVTPDTFSRNPSLHGVYMALEDFLDKSPKATPPLYRFRPSTSGASPLREFTALPDDAILVLGARRAVPVPAPDSNPNTHTTISVCTAVGFKSLNAVDYARNTDTLKPDILVALGDIPYGRTLSSKRIEKATDRNIQWLQDHIAIREAGEESPHARLFASLLPVSCAKQQYFVDDLLGKFSPHISGLAIFDIDTLTDLPDQLHHLPRLAFTNPKTPHEVLRQVYLGLDVLVIPFIGAATDAGIALDFFLGLCAAVDEHARPLPMGIDMWSAEHAIDVSPLSPNCTCYACVNHHRAYIQHLLSAKEMLGWVLLQIHNHHVMDRFFGTIRESIRNGTFDSDMAAFERRYESQLPSKTGQGPRYKYLRHAAKLMADDGDRARGYQYKSEGPGELKKNQAAYKRLENGEEELVEATLPRANGNAKDV